MANKNEYDWAIDRLQDMLDEADQSFDIEALELAIKSIEAWDKVKGEIESNMVSLDGLYSYQKSFHNNCNNVRKECIEIINKHLIEGTTLEIVEQYLGEGRT
jgi:hypothetical protein